MQLIIRRLKSSDLIDNVFMKMRYWIYRNLLKHKLINKSIKNKSKWNLVFDDDFEKVSWRNKDDKWGTRVKWGRFHPAKLNVYYGAPSIVKVAGNKYLSMKAEYKPMEFDNKGEKVTIPYQVSYLSTKYSHKQKYGRFECRCSIPFDKAVWPAFWMWGAPWPPEIDVFELYGGKDGKTAGIQQLNLHYGDIKKGSKTQMRPWGVKIQNKPKKKPQLPEFHEFVCEWSPERIDFYTNGVKIFTYTNKKILKKWFDEEQWVVLNHSIEQNIISPDDKNYFSEFLVDYVRIYEKK